MGFYFSYSYQLPELMADVPGLLSLKASIETSTRLVEGDSDHRGNLDSSGAEELCVYSIDGNGSANTASMPSLVMKRHPVVPPTVETEWIAGLKAGKLDIFRALFEHYTPELRRFATASVSFETAEELVQDVLFNLWLRRKELEIIEGGLTKYLFGAVRKAILHRMRRDRVEMKYGDMLIDLELTGRIAQSPDEAAETGDVEVALNNALHTMTELQRAVMTLRWSQGMSFIEIGEVLDITSNAAMLHASRIKAVLRPILEKYT